MSSEKSPRSRIGYGAPPKHTQFRKGQSGNLKGRPRGSRNFSTVVASTLNEPVIVNENGQRKKITKEAAMIKQLINKAASGDARSFQQVMAIRRTIETEVPASTAVIDDADRQVVQQIIARIRRIGEMSTGDTNE